MGTNYYLIRDLENERLHIGKSSYGWEFTFQAHPQHRLYDMKSWMSMISKVGSIVNEYDEVIPLESFKEIISLEPKPDSKIKKLKNHFDYLQEIDFEKMREIHKEHRIPFRMSLHEVQPINCWKDPDGYSIVLDDFS